MTASSSGGLLLANVVYSICTAFRPSLSSSRCYLRSSQSTRTDRINLLQTAYSHTPEVTAIRSYLHLYIDMYIHSQCILTLQFSPLEDTTTIKWLPRTDVWRWVHVHGALPKRLRWLGLSRQFSFLMHHYSVQLHFCCSLCVSFDHQRSL